jgi:hypothetical protein
MTICLTRRFKRLKIFGLNYVEAFEFCKKRKEHKLCILIRLWLNKKLLNTDTLIHDLTELCQQNNLTLLIDDGEYND